jgi:hypothetical protein
MQARDDERHFGVTNAWPLIITGALAIAVALWIVLFATYRLDRADATEVASTTVLLTVPPFASYVLLMELTKRRFSLKWQISAAFGAGLIWLFVERSVIGPAFGIALSLGECVVNLILLPTFGVASWLALRGISYRKRLETALRLQEQTELRLLEAQLAPHSLFNMLNTVYSVLLTDHQKAIPLFLSMSEALRHVVDRTRKRWISLQEELDFIHNYAALERARNPSQVAIAVVAEGDLEIPIPPMLLATLFENAVKHGRFPDGTLQINVAAIVTESHMKFEVTNRFPDIVHSTKSLGIGQTNVRSRLQMLYPTASTFHAHGDDGLYCASINIDL